ncbi:Hypothetical predicted protein [Octopus vulgaris]|uniref:Uncharacterized protein n=1 Tax=Octopus vulgaris TaxID=6645 RepID=A0AA36B7X0_OCTVU|nr:Hypothetical predicted protein [Octopus vulgaris]
MFHLPSSSCAVLTVKAVCHLQIEAFVLNLPSHCHTVKTVQHCQGRSICLEWKTHHLDLEMLDETKSYETILFAMDKNTKPS